MTREFNFDHLKNPALIGHSMHLHAYRMSAWKHKAYRLILESRLSTDAEGVATCLGLQAEARVDLEEIISTLQEKIGPATLFAPV